MDFNFDMHDTSIVPRLAGRWRPCHGLVLFLLLLLCLNVAVLSIFGGYDVKLGFVHLTAHGLFKPILMMNGCFLVALMICGAGYKRRDAAPNFADETLGSSGFYRALLIILIALLILIIYYPSVHINFNNQDWTHRHISAGIHSLRSAWHLFTERQADGFYRPLTFLSLWLDYRLFGTIYAGYHAQSIALHILNSLLAAWLAAALGFGRKCSLWTGLLFASAAVNFEPVVWPAARFDLLATLFTLMALIFSIRYFRDARIWSWALPGSVLCYILAVLNKESSYCFPLLLLFIIGTHKLWSIPRPEKAKTALCLSLVAAVTIVLISIRIAVYGNLGGYPTVGVTESHHFKVKLKTLTSLLRAMPIPIFGVNSTSAAPSWMPIALTILAVLLFLTALSSRGCFKRKEFALAACALLALIPVLNIVGWIGPPMQHSRYLYLPAIFVMMLIASTLGKIRWATFLLTAFLAVNTMGAISNTRVYLDMLARIERLASAVQTDWRRQPTIRTICLVNLPENPNGVFFFGSELVERIGTKIPKATILRQEAYVSKESDVPDRLIYRWNNADRTLCLVEKP